jgi:hypothetical protein
LFKSEQDEYGLGKFEVIFLFISINVSLPGSIDKELSNVIGSIVLL